MNKYIKQIKAKKQTLCTFDKQRRLELMKKKQKIFIYLKNLTFNQDAKTL